jgi:hypothetical protein
VARSSQLQRARASDVNAVVFNENGAPLALDRFDRTASISAIDAVPGVRERPCAGVETSIMNSDISYKRPQGASVFSHTA